MLFLAGLDFYLALLFFVKGSITFGSVLFSWFLRFLIGLLDGTVIFSQPLVFFKTTHYLYSQYLISIGCFYNVSS